MMKKLLVLTVLLAVGTVQADTYRWVSTALGGDGVSWSDLNNFRNDAGGVAATVAPGAADQVILDQNWVEFAGSAGTMPVVSYYVGSINNLHFGLPFAGTTSLTISVGGDLGVR